MNKSWSFFFYLQLIWLEFFMIYLMGLFLNSNNVLSILVLLEVGVVSCVMFMCFKVPTIFLFFLSFFVCSAILLVTMLLILVKKTSLLFSLMCIQ